MSFPPLRKFAAFEWDFQESSLRIKRGVKKIIKQWKELTQQCVNIDCRSILPAQQYIALTK